MAHARLTGCVLSAGLTLVGCGPSSGTRPPDALPAPTARAPVAPRASVALSDGAWDVATSARFSVSVALPERRAWSVEDVREPWWTARHAPSRSELVVKTWRASRLVTRVDCRKQVKLWRPSAPDPEKEPESVVERRILGAPEGYDTELVVGVKKRVATGEIEGYVLAVGHVVGGCYAALYTTLAQGAGAEDAVAERLALVSDGVMPRIRHLSIEDRVR